MALAVTADMAKKTFIVNTDERGLNLRESPSFEGKIITLLPQGSKVVIDPNIETPKGWVAVKDGGFVVAKYLK